jgi:IclR family KDG regulon transcriptional repressor
MAQSVKLQKNPDQSESGVQSISAGLDLLEIFLSHGPEIGPTDLATLLDMNKAKLHRLLATFEAHGYLYRSTTNGKYRLGVRIFELGSCFQNQLDIRRAALPELASLVEQTEQAAFLCVRDRDCALCVERIEGRHRAHIYALHMGERQPLHCGAAPRALLSGLSDAEILAYAGRTGLPAFTPRTISTPEAILKDVKLTRSQGYVVSNEDVSPGIGAIGSPVRDFTRHVVASISVSGIAASYTPERISALGSVVHAAARRVSEEMGFSSR